MKPPLFVRERTAAEQEALRRGLRSPVAFALRRSQILLGSAAGQRPSEIAAALGCATRTARDASRAFHAEGVGCPAPKPSAPKTAHPARPRDRDDDLQALLHRSPRTPGKATSLWTLALAAGVCQEKGWAARVLSPEAIRQVLVRLGVGWKRAEHWATSPDPDYAKRKRPGAG